MTTIGSNLETFFCQSSSIVLTCSSLNVDRTKSKKTEQVIDIHTTMYKIGRHTNTPEANDVTDTN